MNFEKKTKKQFLPVRKVGRSENSEQTNLIMHLMYGEEVPRVPYFYSPAHCLSCPLSIYPWVSSVTVFEFPISAVVIGVITLF